MELRTLRYLVAVSQEGNLTNAAKALHITQPTLSRQLSSLEEELGCSLFTRTHKGMELNPSGIMLLRYAQSILDLVDKAEEDLASDRATVVGSVHIAAGETVNMAIVAQAIMKMGERFPAVDFQLYSGTTVDLMDGMMRGAYDFMIECEVRSHVNMNSLELPLKDRWGIVVPRESPLGQYEAIRPEDLLGRPLLMARQSWKSGLLKQWAGALVEDYDIRVTYGLPLNASLLARHGVGVLLTYEGLVATDGESDLAFVPLSPSLTSTHGLLWRKGPQTKQAEAFLSVLQEILATRSPRQPLG